MTETTPRRRRDRALPGIARHGRLPRSNPWLTVVKWLASTLAVVLVAGGTVAGYTVWNLTQKIDTVALVGETVGPPPDLGSYEGGFNLLIVGSDRCEEEGGCKDREAELNDVTILLHVSEDQTHATAVSFPRDLVVPIPSCPNPKGGNYSAMSAQPINVTLYYGGLPCTVLTVEALTGLKIEFAGLITFNGVARMSSAVGGVEVCVDGPISDAYSGLFLPGAGSYTLEGGEALAFLRTRKGVGDGSDLGRISSQQVFMSSLVRTLKRDGVLTDIGKLYNIAQVAASNMTLSNSLNNLNTMVSMAQVLKNIPLERVMFVQYPGVTGQPGVYAGKVAPIKSQADALFAQLRADQPFLLAEGSTGQGSKLDTSVDASDSEVDNVGVPVLQGIKGQSAADHTCSRAN